MKPGGNTSCCVANGPNACATFQFCIKATGRLRLPELPNPGECGVGGGGGGSRAGVRNEVIGGNTGIDIAVADCVGRRAAAVAADIGRLNAGGEDESFVDDWGEFEPRIAAMSLSTSKPGDDVFLFSLVGVNGWGGGVTSPDGMVMWDEETGVDRFGVVLAVVASRRDD